MSVVKHGRTETPEYSVWRSMKTRCLNPNHEHFKYYGGRGIGIDEPWLSSFQAFFDDMGPRPSPKHSVDRIDTFKNYGPGNCRWATQQEQCNNKRNNTRIIVSGEAMNLLQACRKFGVSLGRAQHQLSRGRTPDEVFLSESSDAA